MDYHKLVEPDLVKILIKGDSKSEDAFCELYARYRKRLYLFCLTFVKMPDVAEDVVQDVFTTIWTKRWQINADMSFSSYLYTITRNQMLKFLRRANLDMEVKTKLQQAGQPIHGPADLQLEEKEYNELFNKAIRELSPTRQRIFNMSRQENMSHKEIAEALDISPYTVQENISAALKHIKTYLTQNADMYFKIWVLFWYFFQK